MCIGFCKLRQILYNILYVLYFFTFSSVCNIFSPFLTVFNRFWSMSLVSDRHWQFLTDFDGFRPTTTDYDQLRPTDFIHFECFRQFSLVFICSKLFWMFSSILKPYETFITFSYIFVQFFHFHTSFSFLFGLFGSTRVTQILNRVPYRVENIWLTLGVDPIDPNKD